MVRFLLTIFLVFVSALQADSVSLIQQGGLRINTIFQNPQGYYESYVARRVGDVITVRIVENVLSMKQSEVKVNNNTVGNSNLGFQLGMTKTSTLTPDTNNVTNQVQKFTLPVNYSRNNTRDISVDNTEKFFTLISCLVVEIDPESGNMIVEGSRQILMEGETKSLYVRGIVYPKDIDPNNEIPSYKLANAQVQIIGSGSLTKDRDGGVIQKIFRKLF